MNPIIQWLQKEVSFLIPNIIKFSYYYNLRDKLPFYVTLSYIIGRNSNNSMPKYASAIFLALAGEVGLLATYYLIKGIPNEALTGFKWRYVAPIQYSIQIIAISYISWKATKDASYSVALGYNGAAATGYIYEIPFWFFSVNPQAHLLHTSFINVFLIDFQILSIGIFIWLLRRRNISFNKKDLGLFLGVFGITSLMASQMYVLETASIARIPMILYSLYLILKLSGCGSTFCEKGDKK